MMGGRGFNLPAYIGCNQAALEGGKHSWYAWAPCWLRSVPMYPYWSSLHERVGAEMFTWGVIATFALLPVLLTSQRDKDRLQ